MIFAAVVADAPMVSSLHLCFLFLSTLTHHSILWHGTHSPPEILWHYPPPHIPWQYATQLLTGDILPYWQGPSRLGLSIMTQAIYSYGVHLFCRMPHIPALLKSESAIYPSDNKSLCLMFANCCSLHLVFISFYLVNKNWSLLAPVPISKVYIPQKSPPPKDT